MSTYTPIASQTLGSAAASVTFSSIPQGYTDLVLSLWVKSPVTNGDMAMQFNFDTGSNYSNTQVYGDGSGAYSNRGTNQTYARVGNNLQTNEGLTVVHIQNYSNSVTFKTILSRSGSAQSGGVVAFVNLWRNTNPITSLVITPGAGGNWGAGSTFSIYGIQVGASTQKAQGGNIVTTDGTYVYHTFTSSGSFIPSQALTVDYLVVAGGGGGSGANGGADAGNGGGGAGGLRSTTTATGGGGSLESPLSLTAQAYTVTIGAGGAGGAGGVGTTDGVNGSNSVFSTITSTGGSGGNDYGGAATATGGSGGGAGAGAANRSLGTANQGFDGGTSAGNSGGGGGGAGAVGTAGTNPGTGGAGGTGVSVAISGSSVTYAGGGGGGGKNTAGSATGGGGAGGAGNNNGTAGTVNLGGGGGGAGGILPSGTNVGGAGGSGIVIIRYLL